MKKFFIIAFLFISIYASAQPGPYGGTLEFQFTDANGKTLKKKSGLTVWPEFTTDSDTRYYMEGYPLKKIIWENDSILSYDSAPTPSGGFLPPNFTVVAVYKKDTMRIKGFPEPHYRFTPIARITFLKGAFTIPKESYPYLTIKCKPEQIPAALEWKNFEGNKSYHPSSAVLEAVTAAPVSGVIANGSYKVFCNTKGVSAVARYAENSNTWDTILSGITQYPVRVTADKEQVIVTLGSSAFLYSTVPLKKWELVFLKDVVRYPYTRGNELRIDSIWLKDKSFFIRGKKTYAFMYSNYECKESIFKVHINLSDTSSLYRKIKADSEKQVETALKEWTVIYIKKQANASRTYNKEHYPERLSQYLQKGTFYDPDGGRLNHLLLTLMKGRFAYTGRNQIDLSDKDFADYNSEGTYTYTDSTITFWEGSQYAQTVFNKYGIDFVPRGTYYWYFHDNLLILTQHEIDETEMSYHMYSVGLWIDKK
ncbi:hypothetical protein [Cytophaga aurantiaca]|uniref:hypothetical protein n=1 Tax=Cytophaga aurantiaca TaxID=29530 RepID=UPI0012FAD868|nr:hypothetical protein [Cytophaga aurantiaca]